MKFKQKISHARTELRDAEAACLRADEDDLRRHISNCLTAARSVLGYAYNATDGNSEARRWYERAMANSDLFGFCKDLRDADIHRAPVETTNLKAVLTSYAPTVVKFDPETGNAIAMAPSGQTNERRLILRAEFKGRYEDARVLLNRYIEELEVFITDGLSKTLSH